MDRDIEHLQLLSIFHYVVAGIIGLISCFPIIHLAIGIALLTQGVHGFPSGFPAGDAGEAKLAGILFTAIPAVIILGGWTLAFVVAFAGRFLARQTHYTYCLVVAGVACLFMPFGTILGVFTIFVLVRPSVKELFEASGSSNPPQRDSSHNGSATP